VYNHMRRSPFRILVSPNVVMIYPPLTQGLGIGIR
jgi:hypothetical protein